MNRRNLKTRECFRCNRRLDYYEFKNTNLYKFSEHELRVLWNSASLQYYCCTCFEKISLKTQISNLKKKVRKCKNCEENLKLRDYLNSISNTRTRVLIDNWKYNQNIYCKKCYLEAQKQNFIKECSVEINETLMNLVPSERIFLKQLMSEVNQVIYPYPNLNLKDYGFTIGKNKQHLRALSVTHKGLVELPASINFTDLQYLFLNSNKLKTLPESIGSLKSLRILRLSYNRLKSLPDSISQLTSLRQLHLNGNNNLSDISSIVGRMSSLKYLDISGNNNIPYSFLESLPDLLPSLKTLYIMNKNPRSIPQSLKNHKRLMIIT